MMSDNTETKFTSDYCKADINCPQLTNKHQLNSDTQNFYKIYIKEVEPTTQNINENIFEENLSVIIDELVDLYFKEVNKGKEMIARKKFIFDYFNNNNINLQEIYNWLLNNQNSSNSICLFGYFNYHGIETNVNISKAVELYQKAVELDNSVAQFDLSYIYLHESNGIEKDYDKAFELSKKLAEGNYSSGINRLGYCYDFGIGTVADTEMAFKLYQKAADMGNSQGLNNLGNCYEIGSGTDIDPQKAFELYQKAADLGNSWGINNLGHCYEIGIGTNANKHKAFGLYQKAANLGHKSAQYSLALMYENGHGTEKI